MKIPCVWHRRFLLNILLVLNVAAIIIVEWYCRREYLTLKFVVWSALVAHLIIRWPETFYWWDKGNRRR